MYILEILQTDRRHIVGLFQDEKHIEDWIDGVDFIRKYVDKYEDYEFVSYALEYDEIPLYYERKWRESIYPISKFMFIPDGNEIILNWYPIPIMENEKGMIDGATQVDAYVIPNEETKEYIDTREEIREIIEGYYRDKGVKTYPGGLGSEDGEYISVEDGPFIILDPSVIEIWEKKTSIDDFINKLEN